MHASPASTPRGGRSQSVSARSPSPRRVSATFKPRSTLESPSKYTEAEFRVWLRTNRDWQRKVQAKVPNEQRLLLNHILILQ